MSGARALRILVSIHNHGVVGGAETYLRALVPLLRGRGHELALLCERRAGPGEQAIEGAPLLGLGEVAAWKPSVVYQHGLEDPGLEEALLGHAPGVFFAHAYYGTCISGTKRFASPDLRACTRTLGPGCLACYLPRRCGGKSPLRMLSSYALQKRRLRALRSYARVVVASQHMRDEYLRHGLPEERVSLLPLFPTFIAPDAAPPAPRAPSGRVLVMGRLTPLKGARLLVEALPLAQRDLGRPLTLVVAGDGPERAAVEARARGLNLSAEQHGWVGPEERERLLRSAEVLAVPSVWPEPFGLVGIEAGCVGLPAVGFAMGGIPEWLVPGHTGELAPADPPTAEGLAQALVRAMKEPARSAELGRGAWELARRFEPEAHVAKLEALLGQVVTDKH